MISSIPNIIEIIIHSWEFSFQLDTYSVQRNSIIGWDVCWPNPAGSLTGMTFIISINIILDHPPVIYSLYYRYGVAILSALALPFWSLSTPTSPCLEIALKDLSVTTFLTGQGYTQVHGVLATAASTLIANSFSRTNKLWLAALLPRSWPIFTTSQIWLEQGSGACYVTV